MEYNARTFWHEFPAEAGKCILNNLLKKLIDTRLNGIHKFLRKTTLLLSVKVFQAMYGPGHK